MADKEERILISSTKNGQPVLAFPRSEVIERMAKAMADVSNITYVSEEQWKVVENGFRISAEAALNALLEEK